MDFDALKEETFRRLEESSSAPTFVSEADVEDALNDGLMEITDETEWNETWRTVDLLMDRPYYDIRTVFADVEVLTPGRAFNETTNRWLQPCIATELDVTYRRWERVDGQPQFIQMRGLWWLGYWPITASESGTVKQYATVLPAAMEDDTDEPGFEEVFHLALVEYALSVLWPQMGEVTRAMEAWQRYLGYEAALAASVGSRGSVPGLNAYAPIHHTR